MASPTSSNDRVSDHYFTVIKSYKTILMMIAALFFLAAIFYRAQPHNMPFLSSYNKQLMEMGLVSDSTTTTTTSTSHVSPTNLSHLVFGLIGNVRAMHHRRHYLKTWWRPGKTRGHIYLDEAPEGLDLVPWPEGVPPYRVSENLTEFYQEIKPHSTIVMRMNHGILEAFNDAKDGGEFRWLIMGDDDSVFFVENMVDVLAKYDHTKYYYFGGHSEFIMSNFWYSFSQGFGGAGLIFSYPLAKALADGMDGCLRRSAQQVAADHITMTCIANLGVDLTPLRGIHQVDLTGDISGFLSAHPQAPLLSLHHFDSIHPIYPKMDRYKAIGHLMNAAKFDQSRMLQQTIGYEREKKWSISVSWGYSVHLYEKILPRWKLQMPLQTFKPWISRWTGPAYYMFDTTLVPFHDPCDAPHMFYLESIKNISTNVILTIYYRSPGQRERSPSPCMEESAGSGTFSADYVTKIHVYSPAAKRLEDDRCECCDIEIEEEELELDDNEEKEEEELMEDVKEVIKVKYRECMVNEVIA